MTGHVEAQLLRALREDGPQTRSQLVRSLGLPRTTLSSTIASLVSTGRLEDGPVAASTGGRRSVTLRLSPRRSFVAVSVGERRARAALLDGHLNVLSSVGVDLGDRGPGAEDWLPSIMVRATAQVLGERAAPAAIGVAGVGSDPVAEAGVVARLAERFGDGPVVGLSAVRAMALGERSAGAARGMDDFVTVRLGSGATMATVSGGRLTRGVADRSGAIGHLRVEEFGPSCTCGQTGCLDAFVGAEALLAQASDMARRGRSPALAAVLADAGAIVLDDLVVASRGGEPVLGQLARDVGQRVGRVVAAVVAHLDPRCVVLCGPVTGIGAAHVLREVRATVARLAPPDLAAHLDVNVSTLGEQGVLLGAGAAAVDAWIES